MVHIYHIFFILSGKGNGNQLQCSYLQNPMDGGAWWAAVYWIAQRRTQLKWLSSSSSFILSSVDGYLGCSHIFAILSDAAVNSRIQVAFWICVFIFFRYKLSSRVLYHMVALFSVFWGTFILFFHCVFEEIQSHQLCTTRVLFSLHPCQHVICRFFGHSQVCCDISLWFWFALLRTSNIENHIMCLLAICISSLG